MNIAILGYGKMGREIEKIALERGHSIVLKINEENLDSVSNDHFKSVDVAIEFSIPESAFSNISRCFDLNIPIVSGTTGWLDKFNVVLERCKTENQTFFYASNYSLGVNLFFKLNEYLARIMNSFKEYSVKLEETHHVNKLDSPSGTAISLAEGIIKNSSIKTAWVKDSTEIKNEIAIKSYRESNVPGNHKIVYESSFDKISIEHDAKSRTGFAMGAVLAAEFIRSKKGYYTMTDFLKI